VEYICEKVEISKNGRTIVTDAERSDSRLHQIVMTLKYTRTVVRDCVRLAAGSGG
jgi:hypothetical protein